MTRPRTLIELLDAGRPANGSTLFARTPTGLDWTNDALDEQVAQLMTAVAAQGVGRGDRVALQVGKSLHAVALHIALLRLGAVQLPLNSAYTDAEVRVLLGDAEPALFLRDSDRAGIDGDWCQQTFNVDGTGTLRDAAAGAAPPAPIKVSPDDPAAMLYTSGTTGRPKGAVLNHGNLTHNANVLIDEWQFTSSDHLLHILPLFHTHGLFVALHPVLGSGASLTLVDAFDVDTVIRQLPRATVMMGVPTHYARMLDSGDFNSELVEHVRLFTSGSAPMTPALHERLHAVMGDYVLERYGMTETSMLTTNPLKGERKPGTVGRPFPGVAVRIVDENEHPVQGDGVGDVQVRGPNVFAGYWRRPELQETSFTSDGWFRTGDVGHFDRDEYLVLVGRSKDLVITGGLNVYPIEVEAVLDALDGVQESAVVGIPDEDFGEAVTAVVVMEGRDTFDESRFRQACRERLAGFKVPKRIVMMEALPRNAMGKVEKSRLRDLLADGQL